MAVPPTSKTSATLTGTPGKSAMSNRPNKTCDACRRRKTKCLPVDDNTIAGSSSGNSHAPCAGCARLEIACTYEYVHKRGGRPLGSRDKTTRKRARRNDASAASEEAATGSGSGGQAGSKKKRSSRVAQDAANSSKASKRRTKDNLAAKEASRSDGDTSSTSGSSSNSGTSPRSSAEAQLLHQQRDGEGIQSIHDEMYGHIRRASFDQHYSHSTSTAQLPPLPDPAQHVHIHAGIDMDNHMDIGGLQLLPLSAPAALPTLPLPFSNQAHPHALPPLPHPHAQDMQYHHQQQQQQYYHPSGPSYDTALLYPSPPEATLPGNASVNSSLSSVQPPPAPIHGWQQQMSSHTFNSPGSQQTSPEPTSNSTLSVPPMPQPSGSHTSSAPASTSNAISTTVAPIGSSSAQSSSNHQTNNLKWQSLPSPTQVRLARPSERFYAALSPPELEIEDVIDWTTLTFFTSLYIKYNHALSPIVHKPSFAADLATRRDRRDRQFRALLLGLVTYTIGQSPITRMDRDFTRRELEIIQERCHRASLVLHDHHYRSPSLASVGTLIYAYFHCQCNSDFTRASVFLASACELAQLIKLGEASISNDQPHDFQEIQLRRRVYWYLYAIDITSASGGSPVHMIPSKPPLPYPLEVDDELITTQGAFDQPHDKLSTMTGFIAMARLHFITGESLVRRKHQPSSVSVSAGGIAGCLSQDEIASALEWVAGAEQHVDEILATLPYHLAPVQAWQASPDISEDKRSLFGMQRANILITALSAKFVLYDYRQDLIPHDAATEARRDTVAREGIKMVTSIPQDDLASNGESMRGKVFRILLALMSRPIGDGEVWGRNLQDWWDLYMNIQFVSVASAEITNVLTSRETTPTA